MNIGRDFEHKIPGASPLPSSGKEKADESKQSISAGKKAKEALPTDIKELFRNYVEDDFGDEDAVKEFLTNAGCEDIDWIDEKELKAASKILLETESIALVKLLLLDDAKLLKSLESWQGAEKVKILNILAETPELLKLEPKLLFKYFEAPEQLEELGRGYNQLKMAGASEEVLNKILVSMNPGLLIRLGNNFEILQRLEENKLLDKLINFPYSVGDDAIPYFDLFIGMDIKVLNEVLESRDLLNAMNAFRKVSNAPLTADMLIKYIEIRKSLGEQVGPNFDTLIFPYLIKRSEQKALEGPILNLSRVLKDIEAPEWNNLPIREGDISNEEWLVLRKDLEAKIQEFFPGDEHKQKLVDALQWFDKIPDTVDAKAGLQAVRKRVASIIDYIKEQKVDPNTIGNDVLIDEGVKIAEKLVIIIATRGSHCADAVAVGLGEAEQHAKAFTKKPNSTKDYTMNIIVNEWKRRIVESFVAKLVAAKGVEASESLETYLRLMNMLNKPMGLEAIIAGMLYGSMAVGIPLHEAMELVYAAFTEDNLIGYAQDHPLMQAKFKPDPKEMEEFEQLMHDPERGLYTTMIHAGKEISVELYPDEDPDRFIANFQYLMAKAPSVETLQKLKDFIEISGNLDELYRINPEKANILRDLYNQLDIMIGNFKTEKTISLLRKDGFLTDNTDYSDPDQSYWAE